MKKSTLIGTCLLNSGFVKKLTDGEDTVRRIFIDEFPGDDYLKWDTEIENSVGDDIIKEVGKQSNIDVGKFIKRLW